MSDTEQLTRKEREARRPDPLAIQKKEQADRRRALAKLDQLFEQGLLDRYQEEPSGQPEDFDEWLDEEQDAWRSGSTAYTGDQKYDQEVTLAGRKERTIKIAEAELVQTAQDRLNLTHPQRYAEMGMIHKTSRELAKDLAALAHATRFTVDQATGRRLEVPGASRAREIVLKKWGIAPGTPEQRAAQIEKLATLREHSHQYLVDREVHGPDRAAARFREAGLPDSLIPKPYKPEEA